MKPGLVSALRAAALLLTFAASPARADTRVVFSPLVDGPEFDKAMEFFSSYLTPEEYDTERNLAGTGGSWKLGKTLDLYLREFVLVGKGDVNGDGNEESFYILGDPGWCGSKGCSMLIVESRGGVSTNMCETDAAEHHVWITDRTTVHGFRELEASFPVRWRGDRCFQDDPDIRESLPPRDPLKD
jgi:hypothetical protein